MSRRERPAAGRQEHERLWIGNMAPGTTDDEIKALVQKYAPELECSEIQRVEGDGTHPAAMLSFTGGNVDTLGNLALRLNGMYWKGRELVLDDVVVHRRRPQRAIRQHAFRSMPRGRAIPAMPRSGTSPLPIPA